MTYSYVIVVSGGVQRPFPARISPIPYAHCSLPYVCEILRPIEKASDKGQ
jgi:hypothetical protein